MTFHVVVLCCVTLFLLLVSALVSGSETAFFSLSGNDVRKIRRHDTPVCRRMLNLLGKADLLLATILVVNNLVNIGIVILSSEIIDSLFTFARFEFLFKTVIVTFLLLLLTRTASKEEHGMLSGIVSFVNTEVQEIMKPRVDITAVAITDSYEQVKQTIIRSGFSRIPVYEGDLDNIKGTLYVKDLLSHIDRGDEFGWQQLIRRPYFVPEHKKINDLLADFQNQKIHMAIVVDEYGSTQGLVSLEDIVEEVVGEISDESDKDEVFYTRLDKDTYLFDGKTHIGDFERIVEIAEGTFADVKGRAETLAGLMLELKCDFLKKGDTVTAHGVRFTVEEIEGHRIDKIKVRLHG